MEGEILKVGSSNFFWSLLTHKIMGKSTELIQNPTFCFFDHPYCLRSSIIQYYTFSYKDNIEFVLYLKEEFFEEVRCMPDNIQQYCWKVNGEKGAQQSAP